MNKKEELRGRCKDLGLRGEDLAILAGVALPTVYMWGKDRKIPGAVITLLDAWTLLDDEGRAELMSRARARKKAGTA